MLSRRRTTTDHQVCREDHPSCPPSSNSTTPRVRKRAGEIPADLPTVDDPSPLVGATEHLTAPQLLPLLYSLYSYILLFYKCLYLLTWKTTLCCLHKCFNNHGDFNHKSQRASFTKWVDKGNQWSYARLDCSYLICLSAVNKTCLYLKSLFSFALCSPAPISCNHVTPCHCLLHSGEAWMCLCSDKTPEENRNSRRSCFM